MSGLSEQERDSLTECECGHFANEHSSTGCLATDFSEDWRPVRDDDVCSCTHSPSAITRHAVERIKADAVAAAREDRDTTWKIAVATLMNALDVNGYDGATVLPDLLAAAREEAARQWRALVDPLQEAVFEFDVCEPARRTRRHTVGAARPVRRALAADIREFNRGYIGRRAVNALPAIADLLDALDNYGRAIQAEREEAWRIACLAHLAVEAALRGDA